jgi:GDPmannose 4,6-dehydratase
MKINNIQDIKLMNPNNAPVVFVTGVTGQDGSHMVDYLLRETDCIIIGGVRLLSVENHDNLSHLKSSDRFQLVNFDLMDSHSIYKIVEQIKPDYYINFAAQSFVHGSWDVARQTWNANCTSVLDALEAIRQIKPSCRFYNAGSSEEFGNVLYSPQDENHPPRPRSPYGASKCAARTLVKVYRESYGLYAVQGWLFNHEGTRRGEKFVTRKITKGVVRIKNDILKGDWNVPIELGNVDAKRDWSDAEDMVDGVWKMLNQEKYWHAIPCFFPNEAEKQKHIVGRIKDYVCSSNETHTIREFIELAFEEAGFKDGKWEGTGVNETYSVVDDLFSTRHVVVKINPEFYRPAEVELLLGNSSSIRNDLKWKPKTSFKELVKKMVQHDLSNS